MNEREMDMAVCILKGVCPSGMTLCSSIGTSGTRCAYCKRDYQEIAIVQLLDLLHDMQADCTKYLEPDDTQFNHDWLVNRLLWHLDGPRQRQIEELANSAINE